MSSESVISVKNVGKRYHTLFFILATAGTEIDD